MKWHQNVITATRGLALAYFSANGDGSLGALAREGFLEEITLNKFSRS
jgi:hypothetical protein